MDAQNQVVDYSFANNYNDQAWLPSNSLILHKDFKVHDLQSLNSDIKRRFTGSFTTNHPESYFTYALERIEESGAQKHRTFINAENPESQLFSKTILNFGETEAAGHADDVTILNLIKDPVFVRFMDETRNHQEATEFAESLELFLGSNQIVGVKDQGEIALIAAVKAIRNAQIDKKSTSNLNTNGLQYEASDFEKIAIESADQNLPDSFIFTTPVYLNLENQQVAFAVDVKFRTKENGGQAALYALRPLGLINHYLKAAENFQALVSSRLENTLIGSF